MINKLNHQTGFTKGKIWAMLIFSVMLILSLMGIILSLVLPDLPQRDWILAISLITTLSCNTINLGLLLAPNTKHDYKTDCHVVTLLILKRDDDPE